jgi:tagaturonate epimerase
MDDAKRAVEAAKWDAPWGADADHLKTVDDLPPFVAAGYTFFTVDPGAYVDNAADADPVSVLQEKASGQNWDELSALYLSVNGEAGFGKFDSESLLRALVKYGRAIQHTVGMYRRLSELKDAFDFEVSVDETDAPTTALEHYFIANELTRAGVKFTSLAPRFIGRFEKGVDYIGDLAALDAEMAQHAAVTAHFGTYKLSLHSGSDKFSVYPLIVKHWGSRLHVKTAGTSYLEALRALAMTDPALFERIWALGLKCYDTDRATYHVSAEPALVSAGLPLPALLDDFHAREILHVTFGSALTQFGAEIRSALVKCADVYNANLQKHFRKHLDLLK